MLNILGRYFKGRPRLVWRYDWQAEQDIIDVHSDANWAGCKRSRKSSSGGTIAIGAHLIIAKSSGESELYGVIRASTEALGVSTLLEDFGCIGVKVSVGMDANAAIGIVQRRGLNKLRHVELHVLWIQEQQARRSLPLRKVPGPRNPSDMMTKNVDQAHIDMYLDLLNLRFDIGRADIAQNLHSMGENIERHNSTSALLSEDLMPLRRCGITVERAKPITSDTCIPTRTLRTVVTNCPEPLIGELNRLHFDSCRMPRIEKEKAEDALPRPRVNMSVLGLLLPGSWHLARLKVQPIQFLNGQLGTL
jgi:hypothetical protein